MIIIAGCPRSGTTAMELLLNTSPDICILHEFGVLYKDKTAAIGKLKNTPDYLAKVIADKALDPSSYDSMIASMKRYPLYGDKMPLYIMPQCHDAVIQNASFVILTVRDVRDFICSSRERYHHFLEKGLSIPTWATINPRQAVEFWTRANEWLLVLKKRLEAAKIPVVLLRYEEAVTRPAYTLFRLYEAGLDVSKCHTEVYVPTNVGRWRRELGETANNYLTVKAKQIMEKLGYEC